MAVEGYTTLAETTLASGYTASSGTMALTSGALFPAAGLTFSVRVNVTGAIYSCTRVGSTLTVTLEFGTDVSLSAGVSVIEVVTARVLNAIRSNQNAQGLLSALPAVAHQGDQFKPTDGYYDYFYNGAVWVPKYRGMICTQPTQTFGFKNQQSATVSTANGPTVLTVPPGTVNFTLYACPVTPPFTAIALINVICPSRQYTPSGFLAYAASDDHFEGPAFGMDNNLYIGRISGTNFTNFSLSVPIFHPNTPIWVKITDDTVNTSFYLSTDGIDWVLFFTELSGASLTITHVGIGAGKDTNSPGYDNQISLLSLVIT